MQVTHEQFIQAVRAIGAMRLQDPNERAKVLGVKLVYGAGERLSLRGRTIQDGWVDGSGDVTAFAEVCAAGQESHPQLACTTLHELAHALVGPGHGHDKVWKEACLKLGLRLAKAGQRYYPALLAPEVREAISAMEPADGSPSILHIPERAICSMGVGTRGGKSRGKGSGSRLRKYVCGHGQIIRASTDELNATCNVCNSQFTLA